MICYNKGLDVLSEDFVGYADNRGTSHAAALVQNLLHFRWADAVSRRLDHGVTTTNVVKESVFIGLDEVAGIADLFSVLKFSGQKRMRSQNLRGQFGFAPITK